MKNTALSNTKAVKYYLRFNGNMEKSENMSKFYIKEVIFSLVFCLLIAIIIPVNAYASETISVKSFSFEETTIIEFTNNGKEDVNSFRIWLDSDVNFKSFKTESGWIGKKTPDGVIIFTSSESVRPNESIKIGVKIDKTNQVINWKALDKNEKQVEIGKTILKQVTKLIKNETSTGKNLDGGILLNSVFRIIPDNPSAGSSIRVMGDNFRALKQFDFYINANKIGTFESDDNGHFISTVKIPADQNADRVDFSVKDKVGNEKKISIRIESVENRIPKTENIKLTINGIPDTLERGAILQISGTASPNSGITATIKTANGYIINTKTAKVDSKGDWSLDEPTMIPMDAPFGRYSAIISDGKGEIVKTWTIESFKVIKIEPINLKYDTGEIIKFKGTALPNKSLEIILKDSLGDEKYSDIIQVDESGIVEFEYQTKTNVDKKGTWTLIAEQGTDKEYIFVGLGELPSIQLSMELNKLNYRSTETVHISLTGKKSDNLELIIVDSSDKLKKFSDGTDFIKIKLGKDGRATYDLDLTGYGTGTYTVVIHGSTNDSKTFTVGFQVGSGEIKISSTKVQYRPGESILLLGKANSNSLLTITLSDHMGNVWKTKETFSDKNGRIAESELRIPSKAKAGTWVINAKSGSNFDNIEFEVVTAMKEGLSVTTSQGVKIIGFGDSINIKVINAVGLVQIQIMTSNGNVIDTLSFSTTNHGEIKQPWFIPKDTIPGTYTMKVKDTKNTAETTFGIK